MADHAAAGRPAIGIPLYTDFTVTPPVIRYWDGYAWQPYVEGEFNPRGTGIEVSPVPDNAFITDIGDFLVTDLGDYLIAA